MKTRYQRIIKVVTVAVALLFVLGIGAVYADGDNDGHKKGVTYRITVENLTQTQPFSPIVAATHRQGVHMFKVGRRASDELEAVAEDGNNGPMVARLSEAPRRVVIDFFGDDELVLPGASISFELKADRRARLSLAGMLVCTNDGFTGLDGRSLPKRGSKEYYLKTYDAGTEKNTELATDVPCLPGGNENDAVDTNRRIKPHRGIQEVGDLTKAEHGWTDPVAKVVIERIK